MDYDTLSDHNAMQRGRCEDEREQSHSHMGSICVDCHSHVEDCECEENEHIISIIQQFSRRYA